MQFTLALAQSGYPQDGDVLAQIEGYAAKAEAAGATLLAFPEALMSPRELSVSELSALAEMLDGPFMQGIGSIAARHHLWIVGTMSEVNPAGGPPFNTAFAVNDRGVLAGSYQKCHLYDAHGVRESERMSAGDRLGVIVPTPFCTLGLAICYDLRFPESARAAALAGAELLLYPAAWYDGPHKLDHWRTLLKSRAIENELFVAGICHAGEHFVGESLVYGPLGELVAQGPYPDGLSKGEGLVIARIDTDEVASARDAMPIFEHRRPELYR